MAHGLPGEPGADGPPTPWPAMEEAMKYRQEIERRAKHFDALVEALEALLTGPPLEGLFGGRVDKARAALDAAKKA